MRSLIPLVAAAAALVLAPVAGAAEKIGSGYGASFNDSNNDIQLAGDRVVLNAAERFANAPKVVAVRIADGKRTTLLAPKPPEERDAYVRFDASPARFAYALGDTNGMKIAERPSRVMASGPLAGPFERIDACDGAPLRATPYALAVTDAAMAYTGAGCEQNGLTVRSFDGAPTRYFADAGFLQVALAGRYVAYVRTMYAIGQPSTVVADRVTGATVYETGASPRIHSLDVMHLQEDGKLLVAHTGRLQNNKLCVTEITWYSPAEPFAHQLPGLACGADSALSGDRITYVRAAGGRRAELVNTDLSGGDAKLLARFAEAEQELSLDAAGDRVVWHERSCTGDALFVAHLGDAARESGPGSCPLEPAAGAVRVGRDGKARLRVRCPNGCRANGFVDLAGEERASMSGTQTVRGKGALALDLTPGAAAALRRGKTLRGTASVSWDPLFGLGQRTFPVRLVRR